MARYTLSEPLKLPQGDMEQTSRIEHLETTIPQWNVSIETLHDPTQLTDSADSVFACVVEIGFHGYSRILYFGFPAVHKSRNHARLAASYHLIGPGYLEEEMEKFRHSSMEAHEWSRRLQYMERQESMMRRECEVQGFGSPSWSYEELEDGNCELYSGHFCASHAETYMSLQSIIAYTSIHETTSKWPGSRNSTSLQRRPRTRQSPATWPRGLR